MPNLTDTTTVDIDVRHYELDTQGHVNQAVYLMYGEHARTKHFAALGLDFGVLAGRGVGFVVLEQTVKYLRELRDADSLTITSALTFPESGGKAFRFDHDLHRADGTPVAEIHGVAGLLDLTARRLLPDPRTVLGESAPGS